MSWLTVTSNSIPGSTKFVFLWLFFCVLNQNLINNGVYAGYASFAPDDVRLNLRKLTGDYGMGYKPAPIAPLPLTKPALIAPLHPPLTKPIPTPPPPVNKVCFTELAANWWSWYYCYLDEFKTLSDRCPIQDKRIPANTTFLISDCGAMGWELNGLPNRVNEPTQTNFEGAPADITLEKFLEGDNFVMALRVRSIIGWVGRPH